MFEKIFMICSSRTIICAGAVLLSLGCRDLTGTRAAVSVTGGVVVAERLGFLLLTSI